MPDQRFIVHWHEKAATFRGPDGNDYNITLKYPTIEDTETGDKYGCTDQNASNFCGECNKDNGTCVYLTSHLQFS